MGSRFRTIIVIVVATSLVGCSSSEVGPDALPAVEIRKAQESPEDAPSTQEKLETPTDPFRCLEIKNIRNKILLDQPSFAGDTRPDEVMAVPIFSIVNNCGKDVDGLKATLDFQNVVGDTIFRGNFVVDQTIPSGSSINTPSDRGYQFSKFRDEHKVLYGLDESKTRAELKVSKIVFTDGTSLE